MQAAESLYNLAPVLRVMLLGLAIACGPISWVWLRNRQAAARGRLAALTLITLFLTFDLVMFGAFTRLTDSGLGCPDWPGCYGSASPTGAHAEITLAQQEMPTGPVTHTKAWIEMIHRYFATAVGVLILTITAATWVQRRDANAVNPWWPAITLVWVCIQGAFGALTVTMKLQPAIVTLHLLGGLVLLAQLTMQAEAYRVNPRMAVAAAHRRWLWAAFALVWLQVALGGWVSTNYAVLACSEFPQCQGSWWPHMDFAQGFELWRDLGKTGEGEHIAFAALTAIHYTHRLVAYVVLAALAVASWRLWRGPLAVQARWLAGLAALQFATGLTNVVLDWPLVAAVMHTGGAGALVVVLTWALCEARSR
ncbi:COX15/CtaA family protein [Ramlibacter albus]|uniref:COX15/CtaA family protein n=1 Tax=Ramlibacter albus TaxID=2079448 RepID=A0A923M3A8_9BURK|nr:COX15/CtaA family protein [Ramlibacter albus]MBC5763128.1 COX15/CtaA family protein [Ramlibacter albus]